MKKLVLPIILALFTSGSFLFAQQSPSTFRQSEVYYVNVPIEKIFLHRLGYVVVYRVGAFDTARAYIPVEWFSAMAGKGELIRSGPSPDWPSMTVFYRNGEFSHVRLHVRRSTAHESWGLMPPNADMGQNFDVDSISIKR